MLLKLSSYKRDRNGGLEWLIIIFITLILLLVMMEFYLDSKLGLYSSIESRSLILSTLAQVLAGAFGLTLTGVFVVVQLITGYSSRLVFTNKRLLFPTIIYAILFAQSIVLCISVIRNPIAPYFDVAFINGLAVFVLFPVFFLFLVNELNPYRLTRGVIYSIKNLLENDKSTETEVQALANYLLYSFKAGDYDTLGNGIDEMLELLPYASKFIGDWRVFSQPYKSTWLSIAGSQDFPEKKSESEKTLSIIMTKIVQTCVIAGNDPYVPLVLLSRFASHGVNIVSSQEFEDENAMLGILNYYIIGCSIILLLSLERQSLDSTWWCLSFLKNLREQFRYLKKTKYWKRIYTNYLCTLICAFVASKHHASNFTPYIKGIIQDCKKIHGSRYLVFGIAEATSFLNDVFPDLESRNILRKYLSLKSL